MARHPAPPAVPADRTGGRPGGGAAPPLQRGHAPADPDRPGRSGQDPPGPGAPAAAAAGGYADGVRFVDLAPLRDPAQVVPAIARALDLPPDTGPQAVEGLARALRRRQLLLLLDNFEQVTAAAPDVARLLSACPDLALLVTSRAPLRLRWEQEYGVPPLETPDPERLQAPAVLRRNPAVRLFVERAEAVQPGFRLDRENAPAVAAICARLDGLPLALELAAARADVQTPAETLQGLRQNPLDVLSGGPHDLPPRQRSLRHAIAWSYALLSPAERALFRRLAVFAGRCSPEGAVAVNTVAAPGTTLARPRCQAHPGTRLTARLTVRCPASSGRACCAARRGPTGCWRRSGPSPGSGYGPAGKRPGPAGATPPSTWPWPSRPRRACTDRSRCSGSTAWRRSRTTCAPPWSGPPAPAGPSPRVGHTWPAAGVAAGLGLRLAGALGWFWYVRGDRREGLAWLDAMLALEGAADEPHSPRRGARTRSDLAARARALCEAGFLARYLGQVPGARTRLEEALRLARVCDDRRLIAVAAGRLGMLALIAGDLDGAGIYLEESRARAHQAGDRWAEAVALAVDAGRARRQDDLPRAAALLRESLARFKTQGDAWGQAFALQGLAQLAEAGADYTSATHHWRERLALSRALRNLGATAHTLDYLGTLARLQGRFQEAAACLAESLVLRREQGDPQAIAWTLNALGDLSLARRRSPRSPGQLRGEPEPPPGPRRSRGNRRHPGWLRRPRGRRGAGGGGPAPRRRRRRLRREVRRRPHPAGGGDPPALAGPGPPAPLPRGPGRRPPRRSVARPPGHPGPGSRAVPRRCDRRAVRPAVRPAGWPPVRPGGPPLPAGVRGGGADRPGPDQRRDRAAPDHHRGHRREPRGPHPGQAGPALQGPDRRLGRPEPRAATRYTAGPATGGTRAPPAYNDLSSRSSGAPSRSPPAR